MSARETPATGAAGAPAARRPTLSHRVEYAALRGMVAALGALPWKRAIALAGAIGRAGYAPLGIRRRTVEAQIRAAFPEFGPERVAEVARGAYEHLGRITVESTLLSTMPPGFVLGLFQEEVDGWELVEAARTQGKGIILVTGHLGNWELAGAYLAARGLPTAAIARHMGNPLADRFLLSTRTGFGARIIFDHEAVRAAPRALKEGYLVAFLADQGVKGLSSTYVPFFGRPARTPRGPAVFALRMDAHLLFGTALRKPDGRYRMSFEPVPVTRTGDREADVDATVAEWTRILERWVRKAPEQYFWHHRRWRRQPPDTPPELREPR